MIFGDVIVNRVVGLGIAVQLRVDHPHGPGVLAPVERKREPLADGAPHDDPAELDVALAQDRLGVDLIDGQAVAMPGEGAKVEARSLAQVGEVIS